MKFEEVLPALREGKKIRRKSRKREEYFFAKKDGSVLDEHGYNAMLYVYGLLADDWEIIKNKKKVKLRDLTKEQYKTFLDKRCGNRMEWVNCFDCPFYRVSCLYDKDNKCWIDNKDLYSDKFLAKKSR